MMQKNYKISRYNDKNAFGKQLKKKYKISAVRTGVWTLRSRSCYSGVDLL